MAVSLANPAALAMRRPVASATRRAIPARVTSARLPARLASARVVRRAPRLVLARAGADGEGSLLDELDADARCPVPVDQRPASQLRELQDSLLLGWGGLELVPYVTRLGALGAFFYVVISKPIADYSYDPATQPVESIICALVGSFVAVAVFALFIYNNWSYVRDRLLSATVEYEETGWYDGQTYVKDPEMLARDRLLGTYTVRPIVERLRKTLLACGVGVFASLAALSAIDAPEYGVEGSRAAYEGRAPPGFTAPNPRRRTNKTTTTTRLRRRRRSCGGTRLPWTGSDAITKPKRRRRRG